jgi:hypothetical protein
MQNAIVSVGGASPLVECALKYARLGLAVFPVWGVVEALDGDHVCACPSGAECEHPGKHPIGSLAPTGVHSATTDPQLIREWWTQHPDANIGVAIPPDMVVIDVDPRHGGDDMLHELRAEYGNAPARRLIRAAASRPGSTCARLPTRSRP